MAFRVVGAVITAAEPCWLRVWNLTKFSGYRGLNELFLSLDFANLEPRILRFQENFVTVKTEEYLRRILAS